MAALSLSLSSEFMLTMLCTWLQKEKLNVQAEISATSISNLHPSLDETAFIQELVAQFLAHGGYVETARAFAEEVREESRALQNGRETPLKDYQAEEDGDAINRQSNISLHLSYLIHVFYTVVYVANIFNVKNRNPHRYFGRRYRQGFKIHKCLVRQRPP